MTLANWAEKLKELRLSETPSVMAVLAYAGVDIDFQTTIVRIEEDRIVIKNPISPERITEFLSASAYYLQCHMLRFTCKNIEHDGYHLHFLPEQAETVVNMRKSSRLSLAHDHGANCLVKGQTVDQSIDLNCPIFDLSDDGISFGAELSQKDALRVSDQTVFDIDIHLSSGHVYRGQGRVVYSRKIQDLQKNLSLNVGMAFLAELSLLDDSDTDSSL